MARTVRSIMTPDPVVINGERSVRDAARLMDERRVGGLPVVAGGRLVGILTSRDVRQCHPNRLVLDAMRPDPVTIAPGESVFTAYEQMDQAGVERLVVVDDGRVVGVLTKSTVMRELGSSYDPLTGLPRADLLRHHLEDLLARGVDPTLVFLDLDDFGRFNKRFGHAKADMVLRHAAGRIRGFAEEHQGEAFRYGGDEFVILFHRSRAEVLPLIERLLEAVSRVRVDGLPPVSVSAGVAGGRRMNRVPEGVSATADDLINLASRASTAAKGTSKKWLLHGAEERS